MAVRLPTLEQIDNLGADFGLILTPDEIEAFQQAYELGLREVGDTVIRLPGAPLVSSKFPH